MMNGQTKWGISIISKHYWATKGNEVLMYATTRMNLDNIMLSKRSQTQKGHILCDSIYMKYPDKANLWRQKVDS